MPRGDRTGPTGMGPMTGRRTGYCAGNAVPGFMNSVPGFGYGWGRGGGYGRGFGRGYGRGYGRGFAGGRGRYGWFPPIGYEYDAMIPPYPPAAYPPPGFPDQSTQVEALQQHASDLERALAEIRRQIEMLKAENREGEE